MINVKKNVTLSYTSVIDGVDVVYMSATISTEGINDANIVKTIANQELYGANRALIRQEMLAFDNEVYKEQDLIYPTEAQQ